MTEVEEEEEEEEVEEEEIEEVVEEVVEVDPEVAQEAHEDPSPPSPTRLFSTPFLVSLEKIESKFYRELISMAFIDFTQF